MSALWVGIAGMIVYLDTTAIAQFMICQPLIVCPVWGLLTGQPFVGLFFGITFQLLWLGSLPVGAAKFPEGGLGAFVATAVAASAFNQGKSEAAWLLLAGAAVIGILVAHVGREIAPFIRRRMAAHTARVVASAADGRDRRFSLLISAAIGMHALTGFIFSIVCFVAGVRLLSLLQSAAGSMDLAPLSGIWPGLLGAGTAVLVGRFIKRPQFVKFFAAFAVILIAGWLWLI